MFRQFLQLDLKEPHNKQAYSLKKNQLIIKDLPQSIRFDAICYSSQDIMSKIILDLVTIGSKKQLSQIVNLTVTFNYNIQAKDLVLLIEKILEIKIFSKSKFRIGHFQIRNGHISDYNRNSHGKQKKLIDDLDQFQKQIDNCLKLERLWKINEYLTYRDLAPSNIKSDVTQSSKKFGKRTNEFFIVEIDNIIRLILIILPRSRQFVLTRQEQKQIQELYIINKHSNDKQNISFNTPIAQIINSYLQNSRVNIFVSSFPQQDKELVDAMKLSLRLGNPHGQEIQMILESYNKDKWQQLEYEAEKMKKKLKEFQYSIKMEQENMQRLIKIYSKTFNKSFSSIDFLKNKEITNIHTYIEWIKSQIKQREEEINSEEATLKDLHKDMIKDQQRHLFYVNKINKYKQNVVIPSFQTTPAQFSKHSDLQQSRDDDFEPTEEELMYFYDPQKEVNRYRQLKEEELKNKLNTSQQKKNFVKLMEQAKYKMNKFDFNTLEQQFYDLISS